MDQRFDFYKVQYYFELARRNDITNSLAIPIGFITALFTGYAYFFLNLNYVDNLILGIFFLALTLTSTIFAVKAVYHLYTSLSGLEYGYVPEPINLYNYEQNYIKYAKAHGLSNDVIDEKFFDNLKKSIVTTTTKNRANNNFRSNRILKANVNTIYAIFFLFLAAIPFIISKNIYDNKNNKLLNQTIMTTEDTSKNQAEEQDSDTPLPQEPTFPSDQYITESLEIDIPNEPSDFNDTFSADEIEQDQ